MTHLCPRKSQLTRSPYAVQIPILFLAAILVFRNLRYRVEGQGKSKREMVRRIDYLGSLTLVISVSAVVCLHPRTETDPHFAPDSSAR